ncbi:16837_t:CDS:2, partial [Racocetra persica]
SNADNSDLSNLSKGINSIQTKLLSTYQNIVEDSKNTSEAKVSQSIVSNNMIEDSNKIFDNIEYHHFQSDGTLDVED